MVSITFYFEKINKMKKQNNVCKPTMAELFFEISRKMSIIAMVVFVRRF